MSNCIDKNKSKQGTIILEKTDFSNLAMLPNFILDWIENQCKHLICVWNQNGNLLYVSRTVEEVTGHHPDHLTGLGWKRIVSEEDFTYVKKQISPNFTYQTFQIDMCNREKQAIPFECTLAKLPDQEDEKDYFIGLFKNISKSEETQEKMVTSEKMSVAGQLAAGIAHEIRNPLTSLKGFLQLLQAGISQKDVYYQIMSDELDKIETITSELLFISKPLTNKREIESVYSMIDDVMVLLNSHAHIHNVNIVRKDKVNDYHVYCDRSQIKQVLINIIKNAIEATDEFGTVTIKVGKRQSFIKIDVIDEGPGVPTEIVHKIGEPFFTTKEGGTGLGLMITKQILNKHEGDLEIAKNNKKGSTFRIILPKHEEKTT